MKRAGVFVACIALAACNPRGTAVQPSPSPTASIIPSFKFSGQGIAARPVRFVSQTKTNRKQYELLAHSFAGKGKPGQVMGDFQDADIHFFGVDGSRLEAQAPLATLDQATGTVGLEGGVHAKNSTGFTLFCDRLTYDHTTEMIHGEGHVVITDPSGFRATGNRFDSNIALTDTRMQ